MLHQQNCSPCDIFFSIECWSTLFHQRLGSGAIPRQYHVVVVLLEVTAKAYVYD